MSEGIQFKFSIVQSWSRVRSRRKLIARLLKNFRENATYLVK